MIDDIMKKPVLTNLATILTSVIFNIKKSVEIISVNKLLKSGIQHKSFYRLISDMEEIMRITGDSKMGTIIDFQSSSRVLVWSRRNAINIFSLITD